MPPTPAKLIDPRPNVALAAKTADVYVQPDGLMYVTDWNAGLHVLQYEGNDVPLTSREFAGAPLSGQQGRCDQRSGGTGKPENHDPLVRRRRLDVLSRDASGMQG